MITYCGGDLVRAKGVVHIIQSILPTTATLRIGESGCFEEVELGLCIPLFVSL